MRRLSSVKPTQPRSTLPVSSKTIGTVLFAVFHDAAALRRSSGVDVDEIIRLSRKHNRLALCHSPKTFACSATAISRSTLRLAPSASLSRVVASTHLPSSTWSAAYAPTTYKKRR